MNISKWMCTKHQRETFYLFVNFLFQCCSQIHEQLQSKHKPVSVENKHSTLNAYTESLFCVYEKTTMTMMTTTITTSLIVTVLVGILRAWASHLSLALSKALLMWVVENHKQNIRFKTFSNTPHATPTQRYSEWWFYVCCICNWCLQ